MRGQKKKPPVEDTILTHQHLGDHRLQVIVDAATTSTAKEAERFDVGVQYHLKRLPCVGYAKRHTAVAEPELGNLDLDVEAAKLDLFVTPVELECFSGRKGERNKPVDESLLWLLYRRTLS